MNEFIFLIHSAIVGFFSLISLSFGSQSLISFIAIQSIVSNLFVMKQVTLCGFNATCADVYTIGATLSFNMLQEYYGRSLARRSIMISFVMLLFYTISSQIHLSYIPDLCDESHHYYKALLTNAPRITFASFVVFFSVQGIDYFFYGFLKRYFASKFLVLRNYISIMLCQLIDTVLFSFLGLYGIINHIGEIICVSYAIKLVAILFITPALLLSSKVFGRQVNTKSD